MAGRPIVETPPTIRTGFENESLGEVEIAFAFQMIVEERQLDVFLIEFGRLVSELDIP